MEHPPIPFQAEREMLRGIKTDQSDPHFARMDVEALPEEDLALVRKLQEGTLAQEEFEEARSAYHAQHPDAGVKDSRTNFYAWLGNQLFKQMIKKRPFI